VPLIGRPAGRTLTADRGSAEAKEKGDREEYKTKDERAHGDSGM